MNPPAATDAAPTSQRVCTLSIVNANSVICDW